MCLQYTTNYNSTNGKAARVCPFLFYFAYFFMDNQYPIRIVLMPVCVKLFLFSQTQLTNKFINVMRYTYLYML